MAERTRTLKVMEADPNNVGKKIVALDVDTRNILGLGPNDCVHIKAKETLAKSGPLDPLMKVLKLLGWIVLLEKCRDIFRRCCYYKKANVQPAKKVTFAPTQED